MQLGRPSCSNRNNSVASRSLFTSLFTEALQLGQEVGQELGPGLLLPGDRRRMLEEGKNMVDELTIEQFESARGPEG